MAILLDLQARGLHGPLPSAIIQYDLATDPESYGRRVRRQRDVGVSISLVVNGELNRLAEFERYYLLPSIKPLPEDYIL